MRGNKTLAQIESAQARAVRFVRDVLGDETRAAEIESETPYEYAERKKFRIVNPSFVRVKKYMPRKTYEQLQAEVAELRDENETLEGELDNYRNRFSQIAELVEDVDAEDDEDIEDDDEDFEDDEDDDED
jgi:hypothetical protein